MRQPYSAHRCHRRCHSRGSRKPRGAPKWVETPLMNWCRKTLKTPKLLNCKFHRGRKFPQQLTGPLSASASGRPAMSDAASQDLCTLQLAVQVNRRVGGVLLSQGSTSFRRQAIYLTTLRVRIYFNVDNFEDGCYFNDGNAEDCYITDSQRANKTAGALKV